MLLRRGQRRWGSSHLNSQRISARTYLLGLIAAAVIPVWVFAAYLLVSFADNSQSQYQKQAVQIATQSASILQGELDQLLVKLDGLARSEAMERGDFAQLHAQARRVVAGTDQIVLLRGYDRSQFVNTAIDAGQPIPPAIAITPEDEAELRAGNALVTDVYRSPVSGEPRIAVARSVTVAGEAGVLAITIPTGALAPVLAATVPEGWVVGVADRLGIYVTRSQRHDDVTGTPGVPEYLAKAVGASGNFTATNQFGDTLLAGYFRSPKTGWLTAANIPLSVVASPFWDALYSILGLAALALALSVLLAYLVGRVLSRGTAKLVQRAGALGMGANAPPPIDTTVSEFATVDHAFAEAEKKIRARTRELETVLDAAPVAVWFTYDPQARQVIRNRFAAELMAVPQERRGQFGLPATVVETSAFKDGKAVSREERPLTRAMRGETTDQEEFSYRVADGAERHLLTSARPISDDAGEIVGAVQVSLDISERKRAEEQRRMLTRELAHRVKNNLAVVQALTHQTLRSSPTLEAAKEALSARLQALSRAHDVLLNTNFQGADIRDAVAASILAQINADHIAASGPSIALPPNVALALTLTLHELVTNAIKYGALSTAEGRVAIEWNRTGDGVELRWIETGGPAATEPTRAGFGSMMMSRLAESEGGAAQIEFLAEGVRCTLRYPLPATAAPEAAATS